MLHMKISQDCGGLQRYTDNIDAQEQEDKDSWMEETVCEAAVQYIVEQTKGKPKLSTKGTDFHVKEVQ